MEAHSHCGLGKMGDFRGICHGITVVNLLPVWWWDSQLLLGTDLPAGDPEPFHRQQPRAPCPFPDMATTSISGASRVCHDPFSVWELFESWLWGRTKLFKSTLAKNYFPDTLLPWLCWNKVPLCSGSRGRCVLWHTISPPPWVPQMAAWASSSAALGSRWSLFLIQQPSSQQLSSSSSGPAFYSTHITGPLLTCSWELLEALLNVQQRWTSSQKVSTTIYCSAFQFCIILF